jgi:hypothetical protein
MKYEEKLLGDSVELILIFQQGSYYPDPSEALIADCISTP